MRATRFYILASIILSGIVCSCSKVDSPTFAGISLSKINFEVSVVSNGVDTRTEQSVQIQASTSTMLADDVAFGIIGVSSSTLEVLLDNESVFSNAQGTRSGYFNIDLNNLDSQEINWSAYYPHVDIVTYEGRNSTYSIHFNPEDIDKGALVSATVRTKAEDVENVPIVFRPITNNIGVEVYDASRAEGLRNLVHINKVTATNVGSKGVYTDTIRTGHGAWRDVDVFRRIVLFEGDVKLRPGQDNSYTIPARFNSIPTALLKDFQQFEIEVSTEAFEYNGFYYPETYCNILTYDIAGHTKTDEFIEGKEYTFSIGVDICAVHPEIVFGPRVEAWKEYIEEK